MREKIVRESLNESISRKFSSYEELMEYLEDTLKVATGWSSMAHDSVRIYPTLKPGASQWDKSSTHNSIGLNLLDGQLWLGGFSGYDLDDIAEKLGCRKTGRDPQGSYYSAKYNEKLRNYLTKIKKSDLEMLINKIRGGIYAEGRRQADFYRGSNYGKGSGVGDF